MVRMISEKGKVDGEETVSSTSKLKPVNDVTTMPTSFHIPQHVFVALDYPGYVLKWEQVLHTLGGLTHLAECYQSSKDDDTSSSQLTNATKPIELRFRPDDPFSHPIMGHFCSTCNLVVRMVRRRRQRQRRHKEGGTVPPWSYTMEIQGIVIDTGRFRGLADFQWIPEPSDPITQLRSAMTDLDLTRMLSYELNSEDTKLNPIRSFPPPNFSRTELPKNYDFKQSHALTKVQVQNPDGTMSFRLHNPFTHSKAPPIPSVSYLDPIPTTPPDGPFVRHFPSGWKDVLLQKFEERPAWTKLALFNTLTSHPQVKHKLRHLLPLVAYFVTSGPWKFTWVKLGVDPKSHSRYRFFQTLDTRNYYRHASSSSSSSSSIVYSKGRVLGTHKTKSSSSSHLFHGLQRFDSTSIFQLCDLVDPILSELVYTQGYLRDVAHPLDGWYQHGVLVKLRARFRSRRKSLVSGTPYVPPLQDTLDVSALNDEEESVEVVGMEDQGGGPPISEVRKEGPSSLKNKRPESTPFSASSQTPGIQAKVDEIMLQLSQVDPIWQTDRVNPADAFDLFDEEVEFLNEDDVDLDEDEEEEEDGDDDDDEEEEEED